MKIREINREKLNTEIVVDIDSEVWQKIVIDAKRQIAKSLVVPGFRKGHVPLSLVDQKIDKSEILNKAAQKAINKAYKDLIDCEEAQKENIIEDAVTIDVKKIDEKNIRISYVFENYPEFELPKYDNIQLDMKIVSISDEEVEQEINKFVGQDATLEQKKTDIIEKGDFVTFDFKGYVSEVAFPGGEASNYELEIGSNNFIPGFEEQMIGLQRGEEKSIIVTFPSDYHQESLAGQLAKFEIKIHDIKTATRPELTPKLIKNKFQIPGINTEAELRDFIKKNMEELQNHGEKEKAIKAISEFFIENTKIADIPISLLSVEKNRLEADINRKADEAKMSVNDYVVEHLGIEKNELQKEFEKTARQNIILALVVEKVSEELQINVTDEEVREECRRIAKIYKMPAPQIYNNQDTREQIKMFIVKDRLFDKIIEINTKK